MKDIVIAAVKSFIDNDSELLDLAAHEQAISHRIGVYLENSFKIDDTTIRVDCEYNKHLDEPKKINIYDLDQDLCEVCGCASCRAVIRGDAREILEKGFRPDILLHTRGTDVNNLIAIEIKKNKECPFDEAKLKALTKSREEDCEYAYALGAFIWFVEKKLFYKWFENGVEV